MEGTSEKPRNSKKFRIFCFFGHMLACFCPGEAIKSLESVRENHLKAWNSTTVTRIVALTRKTLVFFVVFDNIKALPKGQID